MAKRKSRPAETLEITYRKDSPDIAEVYTAMFGQAAVPAAEQPPCPPHEPDNTQSLQLTTPVVQTRVATTSLQIQTESTPVISTPDVTIPVNQTPVISTPVVTIPLATGLAERGERRVH